MNYEIDAYDLEVLQLAHKKLERLCNKHTIEAVLLGCLIKRVESALFAKAARE